MPENLRDRNRCHKCEKTGNRKKEKLWKCGRCEAITYCSRECQAEDWTRHKENCVPVMITEVEDMGRGLVASRDIKMGEEILIDDIVITLGIAESMKTSPITPTIARSLKQQIDALPEEKVTQFYNLKTVDHIELSERDLRIARNENCLRELKIFRSNKVEANKSEVLVFNLALINHSCAPNADHYLIPGEDEDEDQKKAGVKYEIRAIKDICKGDEITIFYLLFCYGCIPKHARQMKLKDYFGFECKCNVCCGKVDDQEGIIDKLMKILWISDDSFHTVTRKKRHLNADEWKKKAIQGGILLALSQDLYIGKVWTKMMCYQNALFAAQMARNPVLLEKAMNALKELVTKMGIEKRLSVYKEVKTTVAEWSPEFDSKKLPTEEEILAFRKLCSLKYGASLSREN